MKKLFLILFLGITALYADHFYDGMMAYKTGNFTKAREDFDIAIKKENSIQGYFYLGKIYLYGEGVEANPSLAIPYLEQAVMKGNLKAKCYLAEAYLKSHIKQNEAQTLLNQGAKESSVCRDIAATYNITINN